MKELQNNYTTVEQSKRLLELGLPADSADLIIEPGCDVKTTIPYWTDFTTWCQNNNSDGIIDYEKIMPCWSVGRLIEIIDNCTIWDFNDLKDWDGIVYPSTKKVKQDLGLTYIEFLIQSIECSMDVLDFSKLN